MVFDKIKIQKRISDLEFDKIYPADFQELSPRHFTPVKVAIKASKLLVKNSHDKIIDIGSGVGKFCCIGSVVTDADFYGVEKRKRLVSISNNIKEQFKLKHAYFLNQDFSKIDFKQFNGIYFFNSFQEKLDSSCVMDKYSSVERKVYDTYHQTLKQKLNECESGTRLVTYYTFKNKIPSSFQFQKSYFDGLLKFYIKK